MIFVGLLSDPFVCFRDPFPPTESLHPALIWGEVPSLTATWYVMCGWYPWEACNFLKGKGGMDLEEREREEGLEGEEGGRENCEWDVIYERIK